MSNALVTRFHSDPKLAHRTIFVHRHTDATPDFHNDILDLLHSAEPQALIEAFRGGSKSTLAEEYLILGACSEAWPYALIIGESYETACDRLRSIKFEIEHNELLEAVYGPQVGPTWTENEIELANGVRVKALGRGQSMRGVKHRSSRPYFILVDDLEDEDSVATKEARQKTARWFQGVLLPTLDPKGRITVLGTPIHPESLVARLRKRKTWRHLFYPIRHTDPGTGQMVATWAERFPLAWIEAKEAEYSEFGNHAEFSQEYLLVPEDIQTKVFKPNYIKVGPPPHIRGPVSVFVDPARTVGARSSRTGYAAWNWRGSNLSVYEGKGEFHKPDEIIEEIFRLNERFKPVHIGVEMNGLEEFLAQPLRAEQVKRGIVLPIRAMRAPKNKIEFISGLQPFYIAGEVTHIGSLPDLEGELLSFPVGRLDVPNALAYALKMKAGQPVYPDFSILQHVEMGLELDPRHRRIIAISSRSNRVAALLVQANGGRIHVLKDWMVEAPPRQAIDEMREDFLLEAGTPDIQYTAPPEQWERFSGSGLPAAISTYCGKQAVRGAGQATAREALKPYFRRQIQGASALLIGGDCTWTINALSEGYSRRYNAAGSLEPEPEDDIYRLIVEALESFAGMFRSGDEDGRDDGRRYDTAPDGRRFLTSNPRSRGPGVGWGYGKA